MKAKILLLVVTVLTISMVSCQKQETNQTPESVAVITKPDSKGEPAAAGVRPVTIAATAAWTASPDVDWITLTPASGEKGMQEVLLNFTENKTGEVRVGKVTFTSGKYSESFTLTQNKQ